METASGQEVPAIQLQEPPFWHEKVWDVPLLHFLTSLMEGKPQPLPSIAARPASGCSVPPLDPVEDAAAQQLEANVGSGEVVDVAGMSAAAARALGQFRNKVAALGGTVVLKSAYRPAAYQQHLQNVWYKWMHDLRQNRHPACQDLRALVQEEFTRHHLIETQHPVAVSDHTRGLAFDATVDLPHRARLGRRRVTLDSLARLVGFLRPAISADPVHFKFMGGLTLTRHVRYAGSIRRTARGRRNA